MFREKFDNLMEDVRARAAFWLLKIAFAIAVGVAFPYLVWVFSKYF